MRELGKVHKASLCQDRQLLSSTVPVRRALAVELKWMILEEAYVPRGESGYSPPEVKRDCEDSGASVILW